MATWECQECTAVYAVGAQRCPECGSTDYVEDGAAMAKISKSGGPSYAGVTENDDAGRFATSAGLGPDVQTPRNAVEGTGEDAGDQVRGTDRHGQDTRVDGDTTAVDDQDGEEYDPAGYGVQEVNDYLRQCREEGNEDEAQRVLAAEREGKNRSGIVNRGFGG